MVLVTDINIKVILNIIILYIFNINIRFAKKELKWKKYIITEILFIKKQIKLINQKVFISIALDLKEKVFIIYMTILKKTKLISYIHFGKPKLYYYL